MIAKYQVTVLTQCWIFMTWENVVSEYHFSFFKEFKVLFVSFTSIIEILQYKFEKEVCEYGMIPAQESYSTYVSSLKRV